VRHHIGPLLGAVKLSRLTTPMVERFVDEMLTTERSRVLAKGVLGSLKAVVKESQRRGLVAQNAATPVAVKLARRHKQRIAIPSKDEIRAQIEAATGRERTILIIAVFTGMRIGEIRGLRWQDVDFANQLIQVRQRADNGGRIGSLKSSSSLRDIPMAPMVLNALREWRMACPQSRLDLVFPGQRGGATSYNAMREALGPMHRYRHFFASWLIDQRFGPKRVQALMGHSSIGMTFDTYGHLFPAENDHAKFAAGELALVG
jgi:integrase